ncbi:serine/threonine-protein kinase fhke-related [Anaeramoeba ignava]|uniref:Serine/threonine-protein kinase fhke-related n=1 Tax=Anaeramoeba ignava TaxID=1746090 RepID=A0A9Q0LP28_ANAIG|nr:serine/threonine-protein kinase fhke-related [Anaeramoeba ignava]
MSDKEMNEDSDTFSDAEPDDSKPETVEKSQEPWGKLVSLTKGFPNFNLISNDPTIFGRLDNCNYIIADPRISSYHCSIYRTIDTTSQASPFIVFLKDQSSNGTFVNGKVVGKGNQVKLFHSDEISFVYARGGKSAPINFSIIPSDHFDESKLYERYEIKKQLGSGQFAVVKLIIDKITGEEFALKIIDRKKYINPQKTVKSGRNKLMDEVNILRRLHHPNIVNISDIYLTERYLYLVLEYCAGGELFDRIVERSRYNEEDSKAVFKQLLSALIYMHRKGIVHRDLKPENILVSSATDHTAIKIADFGLSRLVSGDEKMQTLAGTTHYLAPEVVKNANRRKGYSKACDMWSAGVLLYILLSGYMPFSEDRPSRKPLVLQIVEGDYDMSPNRFKGVSVAALHLVRRCLTVSPQFRITANEAMEHPWILGKSDEITDQFQKLPNPLNKDQN